MPISPEKQDAPPAVPSDLDLRRLLARASHDLSHALDDDLRAEEMRMADYEVLSCAAALPDAAQHDLAAASDLDPRVIVIVLDRLEEAGQTKRRFADGEKHRRVVEITAVGHRTLRRCAVIVAKTEARFFTPLEEGEQRTLGLLLSRLPLSGPEQASARVPPAVRSTAAPVPHPPGSRHWC